MTGKAHATWSASATDRNWQCPGALALTKDLPERTSEPADWGTCCHEIAEHCLTRNVDADSFIGQTLKGKKFSFEVDDEMAETAQVYVDYVRERFEADIEVRLLVEQRFNLDALKPPFDAGGTADAVLYFPNSRHLEVVDLKGGRGVVVEVEGNPQLRTYALGALMGIERVKVETIAVTIVQPRAPHRSGRIRSETFHVADLVEWSADLLAAMRLSKGALDAFEGQGASVEWARDNLKTGPHCKFCPAAGFCPALEQKALDDAGVWFDDLDKPRLANSPDTLSPERAAQLLDAADLISDWINAVRAYWHEQAELGVEIPGYVLVPKQGREKWNDGVESQVIAAAQKAGLEEAKYLNPAKLKTPKQIRKALGKKHEALVEGLSSTPDAGTNLVSAEKTNRQPVAPKAHQFLDIMD